MEKNNEKIIIPLSDRLSGIKWQQGTVEQNRAGLSKRRDEGEVGIKIELKGRLRGANKTQKIRKLTRVGLHIGSKRRELEYVKSTIYTKWGTIGIKTWRAPQ